MSEPAADPPDDAHYAIGEVLARLQGEFPDVTISKIRFLESQGLIAPERTASGYRVFYDADVQRLRWILHQQREYFLPLKIIKERLDEHGPGAPPSDEPAGAVSPARERRRAAAATGTAATEPAEAPAPKRRRRRAAIELPFEGFASEGEPDPTAGLPELGAKLTALARGEAAATPAAAPDAIGEGGGETGAAEEGARYDRVTLTREAGLAEGRLQELEAYGLVVAVEGEGMRALYDDEALATARAAAGFFRHGVEARHIKMYQHFAEREAALFAQVLMPFLRQRNPAAHARFEADLADLTRHSRALRGVLLYRAVRESLTE
ncbi:MAG TPA: MerR family transcriptional regulator [Acidimicrobiia bacterium]|nr:MerR family transcriptional regulator [Acidimicrobiia bacterium]